MTAPRSTSTPTDPPRGCGPAWERPGAGPARHSRWHLGAGTKVQRAGDQRPFGDLGTHQLALDRAVVHHEHAVAATDQLVVVGRVEQDGRALPGQVMQQLVDL